MVTVIYVPKRKKKTFLSLAFSTTLMLMPSHGAHALDVGVGSGVGVNADVNTNVGVDTGSTTRGSTKIDGGAKVDTDSETGVNASEDAPPKTAIPEKIESETDNHISTGTKTRSKVEGCDDTDNRQDNNC